MNCNPQQHESSIDTMTDTIKTVNGTPMSIKLGRLSDEFGFLHDRVKFYRTGVEALMRDEIGDLSIWGPAMTAADDVTSAFAAVKEMIDELRAATTKAGAAQ